MKAEVGDHIVLAGTRVDDPIREGEVLEVKSNAAVELYTVRWSDGRTGLIHPGPVAVLRADSGHKD